MKRLFVFPLALLLFAQCRKQDDTVKVAYNVTDHSGNHASCTITYTSDKSGASKVVSSGSGSWDSGTLLLSHNEFVSLRAEASSPVYDFTLQIFANGSLWKLDQFANPTASLEISGTLQ